MPNSLYEQVSIQPKPVSQASSQMYRGFSSVATTTNNFKLYDYELIKQDLVNSFYVRQGERLMQPTIGCIIWDLLFEPLTQNVKDLIVQNVETIVNSEPRVKATNIVVTQYESGIQIEMTLMYVSYNLQENLQIKFDQENGLRSQVIA